MASRKTLTDGTGRWFDLDTAEKFDEDREWDGRNHISRATGSQWDHETLYRTAGGRWILHSSSQWEGSLDGWEEIDDERAARWLSNNGHGEHPACAGQFAALEIK